MPELSADVCFADFRIYCTSGWIFVGEAGNYRGEVLGGIMIQLVLQAASRNLHRVKDPIVHCDNIGGVNHGNSASKPLLEKRTQADGLRLSKRLTRENPFVTKFQWVDEGHDAV